MTSDSLNFSDHKESFFQYLKHPDKYVVSLIIKHDTKWLELQKPIPTTQPCLNP